jgi:hypothetical protein
MDATWKHDRNERTVQQLAGDAVTVFRVEWLFSVELIRNQSAVATGLISRLEGAGFMNLVWCSRFPFLVKLFMSHGRLVADRLAERNESKRASSPQNTRRLHEAARVADSHSRGTGLGS